MMKPIPNDINLRFKTIFLDWKEGKPHSGSGKRFFAMEFKKSPAAVIGYMTGRYKKVPDDVMNRLEKMGYSKEWLYHGTGEMKKGQKKSLSLSSTLKQNTELYNLKQHQILTDARLAGLDKELHKELQEVKDKLITLESLLNKLVTTDNPLTKTK